MVEPNIPAGDNGQPDSPRIYVYLLHFGGEQRKQKYPGQCQAEQSSHPPHSVLAYQCYSDAPPEVLAAPITSRDGFVALAKGWDPEDLPSNLTADVPLIEHHSRATHNNCGSQRDIDDYPTDGRSYGVGGALCTDWPTIHLQRRNLTQERRLPMQRGSRAVCQ